MVTLESAKQELAEIFQQYIIRNRTELNETECTEIIITLCTLYHFRICRDNPPENLGGLYSDKTSDVWGKTDSMVATFLTAAERLVPQFSSSQNNQIITERVKRWYEVANTRQVVKTSKLLFDFDIRREFNDFLA